MLDIGIALAIGITFGVVAGLVPGLHPNNTIPMILGLAFLFPPETLVIILVSSGISNIFINFIPSVLLGAPEDAMALGVLPGHRLLLQGRGFEAIKISVMGALGGVIFSVAMLPLFSLFIPSLYAFIRPYMHFILTAAVVYMIWGEKKYGKLAALFIFLASGFLGLIVLDFSDAMLFPLLSGLFGLPTLIISIREKTSLPKVIDKIEKIMPRNDILKSVGIGGVAGIIAGLLPGLGSAQSTALTQQVFRDNDNDGRKFLVSVGAVAGADLIYSLLALYLIGNPRSGTAVAVSKLIEVGTNELISLIFIILVSAGIAAFLALKLTKVSLRIMRKVNYQILCISTLVLILGMILLFSGVLGLIVAIVSAAIGLLPNYLNVKRTHSMGCLLLSTILFFAGIRII